MKTKIEPISPDEVIAQSIPGFVIESINALIIKNWNGFTYKSRFTQNELVELILETHRLNAIMDGDEESLDNLSDDDISDWLHFSDMYEEKGWSVKFNRPSYYEKYAAFFVFSKKFEKENNSV